MISATFPRLLLGAGLLASALLAAPPLHAHGRFPNAGLALRHPTDANKLLVRTTYGLLSSQDGGGRWLWTCPSAVGWDADLEDPAVAMLDQHIIAGTFDGLAVSSPDACNWDFVGGEATGRFFRDLVMVDATHALAVASNGLGNDQFDVELWQTSDGGTNWAILGVPPPADFLAVAISASSDGSRIYLSGRDGSDNYEGVLFRSDDGAESWQRLPVPGTLGSNLVPYLAGVSPSDEDTVYVASIAVEGLEVVRSEFMVSPDGGASFSTFFERDRGVSGFALSPDGSRIALGGSEDGLWLGNTSDHQLALVNELAVGCLSWHEEGIYACASQFTDGFTLGLSKDDGVTFTGLMRLDSPCGPLECGADSDVGLVCPARWEIEKQELNAGKCDLPPPAEEDPGCNCALITSRADPKRAGWAGWLFALLALVLRRRFPS